MLNRRRFVHHLGAGAAGSLALLQNGVRLRAADLQNAAARAPLPPGAIRIGSNENPYGPTPAALDAARISAVEGNRYGGGGSGAALAPALATLHGVPAKRILISGGSGDVLRAAMQAFTGPGLALVSGSPSYEQPVRQAKQAKVPVAEVPLTADLKLDLPAMLDKANGAGLLYICNPNNPTATIVPVKQVIEVIDTVSRLSPNTYVLVDEAYFEFADDPAYGTVIPLVDKYPQAHRGEDLLEDPRHGGHAGRIRDRAGGCAGRTAPLPLGLRA